MTATSARILEREGGWDAVLAPHLPEAMRQRLASARVGIAGAGGLGSNCAVLLARSGVGHLVIVDFDVVSLSNLNRQQYLAEHLGRSKVEALSEILTAINPGISVQTRTDRLDPENAPSLFADCPIVVEALDRAPAKKMLLESMLRAGKQVVAASGIAGWGGPSLERRDFGGRAIVFGDGTSGVCEALPVMAPRVMIAAAMQADQVLRHILGPCPGMQAVE